MIPTTPPRPLTTLRHIRAAAIRDRKSIERRAELDRRLRVCAESVDRGRRAVAEQVREVTL